MTSRTHTPEDVQKIMEPWSPVSIGVDVTEEGAHVVGIYALDNDTSQVFYAKYYPVPQRKPLTDEQARFEFEAWHKDAYTQSLERYGHTYKNHHTRCRWQGWLAAHGIKGEA